MASRSPIHWLFPKFKYVCSAASAVLLIWLFCHLFIRSCGGPFPQRTRGPFAKYEYYRLADFPDWENQIKPDPKTGKTRIEALIEQNIMDPVQFGTPPASSTGVSSAGVSSATAPVTSATGQ